jgi:hypothetical protein
MVEQASSNSRDLPERKTVKAALKELGLSNRQVDSLLRNGWRALIGETEAELIELREAVEALGRQLKK